MSELNQTILVTYLIINVFTVFYMLGVWIRNSDIENIKEIKISRLDILVMILFLPSTVFMLFLASLCFLLLAIGRTKLVKWLRKDIEI